MHAIADGTVNAATPGVTHPAVLITLRENGHLVDQVQITSTGHFRPRKPVTVPPLTAVESVPREVSRVEPSVGRRAQHARD